MGKWEKKAELATQVDRKKLWRLGMKDGSDWTWSGAAYYLFAYVTILYFTYRILWFVVGVYNCAMQPDHCHLFGYTPEDGMKMQMAMGYGPKAEAAVAEL